MRETKFAPATLQLTVKGDAAERRIKRATVRATDGSIAKLQRKHDEFKTLATLHIDGDRLYAYIGKKEGVKSGDKYEVLEQTMDEDGVVTFKLSVRPARGCRRPFPAVGQWFLSAGIFVCPRGCRPARRTHKKAPPV